MKLLSRNFRTNFQDTSSWYSSRRIGESCSGYKVLIGETSNRILGAHVLGPHAEEVINIFALAIRLRLDVDKIKEAIFTYPTNSSILHICYNSALKIERSDFKFGWRLRK